MPSDRLRSDRRPVVVSTLTRPFSERWIVARWVAVLVGQRPWNGPGCVELLTWCPAAYVGSPEWTELKGKLELGCPMKKKHRAESTPATRIVADPEFEQQYPTLAEYLFCTCYDDDPKQPRVTSTLLVFGGDGCVKGCLRDRAEGVCAWAAATSVSELLAVLERELAADTCVWRLDRLSGAPEATRKPRGKST